MLTVDEQKLLARYLIQLLQLQKKCIIGGVSVVAAKGKSRVFGSEKKEDSQICWE